MVWKNGTLINKRRRCSQERYIDCKSVDRGSNPLTASNIRMEKTTMLFLKVMEDMGSTSEYTNKVIASYLMFVKSTTFIKLSRIYFEGLYHEKRD